MSWSQAAQSVLVLLIAVPVGATALGAQLTEIEIPDCNPTYPAFFIS